MLMKAANDYYRAGDYEKAIELYEQAKFLYPFTRLIDNQIDICLRSAGFEKADFQANIGSPKFGVKMLVLDGAAGRNYKFLDQNSFLASLRDWAKTGNEHPSEHCSMSDLSSCSEKPLYGAAATIKVNAGVLAPAVLSHFISVLENFFSSDISDLNLVLDNICEGEVCGESFVCLSQKTESKDKHLIEDLASAATDRLIFRQSIGALKKAAKKSILAPASFSPGITKPRAFKSGKEFLRRCLGKSYVLNLAHRKDRRDACSYAFGKIDIEPQFVNAIYGKESDWVRSELSQHKVGEKALRDMGEFSYKWEIDFYTKYKSARDRQRHYLSKNDKIFSLGSFAYMLSYRKALVQALTNSGSSEYVAIFDDDVVLHRNWAKIAEDVAADLPDDFMVLSLGAIQYNWDHSLLNSCGNSLYQCFGVSMASHATVYRKEVVYQLINEIDKMELPFDVGCLHYLKLFNFDKSYVAFPNLFIQDSSESDIADTDGQLTIGIKKDNIYKWQLDDYYWPNGNGGEK